MLERTVLYCVPIPGESAWTCPSNKNATFQNFKSETKSKKRDRMEQDDDDDDDEQVEDLAGTKNLFGIINIFYLRCKRKETTKGTTSIYFVKYKSRIQNKFCFIYASIMSSFRHYNSVGSQDL